MTPYVWTSKPPPDAQIDWTSPASVGLAGCWMFNEMGGSVIHDATGNSGPGQVYSGSSLTASGLVVPGAGGAVSGSSKFFAPTGGDMTIIVALTQTSTSPNTQEYACNSGYWYLRQEVPGQIDGIWFDNQNIVARAEGEYPAGTYFNAAMTVQNNAINTVYLDGVPQARGEGGYAGGVARGGLPYLYFGCQGQGGEVLNGTINYALLYNRCLLDAELQGLWATPFPMFLAPPARRIYSIPNRARLTAVGSTSSHIIKGFL